MNVGTTSNKSSPPKAPEKGSFPLDHDAECKIAMQQYLICLKNNKGVSLNCRYQAKTYFKCRMDQGLMAKEDFDNLGFFDNGEVKLKEIPHDQKKEATGFVAASSLRQKKE